MTETAAEQLARAERERLARRAARSCGGCTACCTVLGVVELAKPMQTVCQHECSKGCAIYETRPQTCADFVCLWREGWGTEAMRPDQCGFMLWTQEQPEVYRYAQGFFRHPPTIVVAYEYRSSGAFAGESFGLVRRNLLAMGAVLLEFRNPDLLLYGARFPVGKLLQAKGGDSDMTRMTIVLPES